MPTAGSPSPPSAAGICGASDTIANAYLADITKPEERARVFGLMGAAFGLGFVIGPAIGPDGMRYLPMLLSMFFFIFITNLFEVIPTAHMPANARMANPVVLALITFVMYVGVGLKHHKLHYLKEALFPPGVPKALYILVTPIELLSTFIIRPFSLAVRLFANMLAGHILLVTFSVLCITLWGFSILNLVNLIAFPMLVAFTGFEFMVAFLQAFIFALLTAVYIGGSLHPGH